MKASLARPLLHTEALTTFRHLPPGQSFGTPVQAGHLSRGMLEHDSRHPSLPPGGHLDSLHIQPWIGGPGATHLALSLKEMSAVPGGAFRTFWEPEYKTSMPVGRRDTCSCGRCPTEGGVIPARVPLETQDLANLTVWGNLGTHHATGIWSERDTLAGPVLPCGV